ncbi:MAG: MerR family transcriptional regulator, heat shock protein HspR [Frankiales bacterium]|jgi:MerR family transcriptional regulator/heat shock protein HspR|nr:MerR family transcriptional regulator, heat shock protein HspR [Frankiales bacterium]
MTGWGPLDPLDLDAPVFVISVAAQLAGMHPQTLRQYDRLGLVSPDRSPGRGRRYSSRDVAQLREVQRLSQEEGVNLAGVKRILELENQVAALAARVRELAAEVDVARGDISRREAEVHASYRRDLVPVPKNSGLVVWHAVHDHRS